MKPFYTIEVRNNRLIQLHGYANKWLGSERNAALIKFVAKWLKEKKISFDKNILLCTSGHYGSTQDFLDIEI